MYDNDHYAKSHDGSAWEDEARAFPMNMVIAEGTSRETSNDNP